MLVKLCRYDSAVLFGVALMLFACIVWLKLVSYAHTNFDMRALAKSADKVHRHPCFCACVLHLTKLSSFLKLHDYYLYS